MRKIITVSREFGSGGRELGKRLADALGIAYYDTEIIAEIAKITNLDTDYITSVAENSLGSFNFHFGHTFGTAINQTAIDVIVTRQKVIKALAEKSDCLIVGRCAESILQDYNPLKIFVYADMDSKLKRCREKNPEEAEISDKQMIKQIKSIDAGRKRMYQFVAGTAWGDKECYDLCINTSGINIKSIIPSIKDYAENWFLCKTK